MENERNDPAKLKTRKYVKKLRRLQAELCKLQDWVKHKGLRVIVIFEGRDGAGKGACAGAAGGKARARDWTGPQCTRR